MRTIAVAVLAFIVGAVLFVSGLTLAYADALVTAPAPNILVEVWAIVQPLVVLFLSIVAPALVTWLAVRLAGLLKISDANAQKELEAKIRTALHAAALNGLKFAMTRAGLPSVVPGVLPPTVIAEAIGYVRTKSPDTAAQAGVGDRDLEQIILSKVPDVLATIAATKAPLAAAAAAAVPGQVAQQMPIGR